MSFYVGKPGPSYDTPLCHITSGSHSQPLMAGPVFEDTIFHSNIDYVFHKAIFNVLKVGTPNVLHSQGVRGVSGWGNDLYYPYTAYELPQELIDLIVEGYAYLIAGPITIGIAGDVRNSSYRQFTDKISGNLDWNHVDGYPSASFKYLVLDGERSETNLNICVLGIKYDGTRDVFETPLTNEVLIGSGGMLVNGIDVARLRYVTINPVNNSDIIFNVGRYSFQFVNESSYGKGLKIESSSGNTKISVDNNVIIDSSIGAAGMKYSRSGTYIMPAVSYTQNYYRLLATLPVLTEGEVCFATVRFMGPVYSATFFGDYNMEMSFQYGYDDSAYAETVLSSITSPHRGANYKTDQGYPTVVTIIVAFMPYVIKTAYDPIKIYGKWQEQVGNRVYVPEISIGYVILK